jgi:hypothetical protein
MWPLGQSEVPVAQLPHRPIRRSLPSMITSTSANRTIEGKYRLRQGPTGRGKPGKYLYWPTALKVRWLTDRCS